jgi:hypothetical protein
MLSRARGEFIYIHGHDDLLEASCIGTLLAHMDAAPECSVAFSDMQAFGTEDHALSQPSVRGSPFERLYDVMAHHYNAIAFTGLIRTSAARPGLRGNDHDNFSADTAWMMQLAWAGELHRIERPLFRKRFHPDMSHLQWTRWPDDTKIQAWCVHCAQTLDEALGFDLTAEQQWLLVWSALQRLLLAGPTLGPYGFIRELSLDRKAAMVSTFFALVSGSLRDNRCPVGNLQMTPVVAASIADALSASFENLTDQFRQRAREQARNDTLTSWLAEANADRESSRRQIEQLTAWLKEANADRTASRGQIEQLTAWLKEANQNRATAHEQNRQLTAWLEEANADRESCHRKLANQATRIEDLSAEATRMREELALTRIAPPR